MADEDWHYLENQFDNTTKDSFKRAHQQGVFHTNALDNAPAAIKAALTAKHSAAWTPFAAKYAEWLTLRGQSKGATLAMEQRLDLLSSTGIEAMETAFKGGYARGTPEHETAFPLGREPFQNGGANDRINAVSTLKNHCAAFVPVLQGLLDAAVAASAPQEEIDALTLRVLSMTSARNQAETTLTQLQSRALLQDDKQTEVDLARTQLEPLRKTWADAIYSNLMLLGSNLHTEALRPQVAAFFDLAILRETGADEEEPPPIPPPGP